MITQGPVQLLVISLSGLSFLLSAVAVAGNLSILLVNFQSTRLGTKKYRTVVPLVGAVLAAMGWYMMRLVIAVPMWPMLFLCSLDAGTWLMNLVVVRIGGR